MDLKEEMWLQVELEVDGGDIIGQSWMVELEED